MGGNLAIFGENPKLRDTPVGRLLQTVHERYDLPTSKADVTRNILELIMGLGTAMNAINPKDFSIDHGKFKGLRVLDIA